MEWGKDFSDRKGIKSTLGEKFVVGLMGENKSKITYTFVFLRTHAAGSKLTITSISFKKHSY